MNTVNKSIFVFGWYTLAMGITLLFFPTTVLPFFGFSVTGEPWLNLLGFVLVCSSYYYIRSALSGNIQFALLTIHTRFAAPIVVVYLIISGKADWHFISFGVIDSIAGLWTWYELKKIK